MQDSRSASPTSLRTARPGVVVLGAMLVSPLASERLYSLWKATRDGASVAVYLIGDAANAGERARFAEGARAMATLAGVPGVLVVREVGGDGSAFVSDLHDTGTATHLPALSWPIARRVDFVRGLCETLATLHGRGVVHGCLRPASLYLDKELRLVLADVGLADVTAELAVDASDAMSFGVYAAPEAATGGVLDARSDVFSIGRVLHFLLVAHDPEPIIDPCARLESLVMAPPGLTRIVRKCVMEDPDLRYATATELAADLARYREGATVGIGHPDEASRASRPNAVPAMARPTATPAFVSRASLGRQTPTPPEKSVRAAPVEAASPAALAGADLPASRRIALAASGGVLFASALAGAHFGVASGVLALILTAVSGRAWWLVGCRSGAEW